VQATFLAKGDAGKTAAEGERLRLLAPRQLVESAEGGARVWLVDGVTGTARLRGIKTGMTSGDLVEILDGLTPADRLIASGREGLREGRRVVVTSEDTSLGITARAAASSAGTPSRLGPGGASHQGKH
jgi:multidrug efflux pump subunit AcrA (membrane-fusion protein)